MNKKIDKTSIYVELVGGPKDGELLKMLKPCDALVKIKSELRSDIYYVYKFDDNPKNNSFPLIFRFHEYEKIAKG